MNRSFPIPVLMYHDLSGPGEEGPRDHGPYVLAEGRFEDQLSTIAAAGFRGVRLDALLAAAPAPPSPGRPCVLTFDDGHESNCTRALPRLLRAGFQATFFVTAGWMGRSPYLSWEQLRTLAEAGMEIGSHSMTHRPPAGLSPAELRAEMEDSRRLLEDRIGRAVVSASSPTGFFNPRLGPIVRDLGYRALCVGRIGLWSDPADAYRIPRLAVKRRTGLDELGRMVRGDGWLIARLRGEQAARNGLKSMLGADRYLRVRRWLLGRRPSGAR